jgi:hypothetical protein
MWGELFRASGYPTFSVLYGPPASISFPSIWISGFGLKYAQFHGFGTDYLIISPCKLEINERIFEAEAVSNREFLNSIQDCERRCGGSDGQRQVFNSKIHWNSALSVTNILV